MKIEWRLIEKQAPWPWRVQARFKGQGVWSDIYSFWLEIQAREKLQEAKKQLYA